MKPVSLWKAWKDDIYAFLIRLVYATIIFAFFWFGAKYYNEKFVKGLSNRLEVTDLTKIDKEKIQRTNLIYFELANSMYYVVILVGASFALSVLGIANTTILTVLGTLGLAISLSMQKYLSSVVSGVVVSANDWFNIGDDIRLEFIQQNGIPPIEGRVVNFDLLRTVIISPENKVISVPNDSFLSNSIVYNSSSTK